MDPVGHDLDQLPEEVRGFHLACPLDGAGEGELARAVDRHKEPQLALAGLHFGDVDVEIADRVAREAFLDGLVAFDLGQAADPVPLQTSVQG